MDRHGASHLAMTINSTGGIAYAASFNGVTFGLPALRAFHKS
jgi:hypothetical protein